MTTNPENHTSAQAASQIVSSLGLKIPSANEPLPNDAPKTKPPNQSTRSLENLSLTESERFRRAVFKMDESHPSVFSLCTFAEWWLKRAGRNENDNKPRMMIVAGGTGAGKTHLADSCYRFLTNHAIDLYRPDYWRVPPLIRLIPWLSASDPHDPHSFRNYLDSAKHSHVVILDDIGAESEGFKNGGSVARLQEILDAIKNKWVLITTNIPEKDWATKFGPRVQSRLESATYVDASAIPDYRLKKGRNDLAA